MTPDRPIRDFAPQRAADDSTYVDAEMAQGSVGTPRASVPGDGPFGFEGLGLDGSDVVDDTVAELSGDGAGFETEPRSAKRYLAPLALVAGLAVAVGGAFLIPSAKSQDVAEATTPAISGHREQPISRSSARPVLSASPTPTASITVTAPATPSVSASRSASATPRASRTSTPSSKPTPKAVKVTRSIRPTAKAAVATRSERPKSKAAPLGEVTGSRYATTVVNVRALPDADSRKLGTLRDGQKISVTSVRQDGWRQVKYDGDAGWVRSDYLTSKAPVAASTDGARSGGSGDSASGSTPKRSTSGAACKSTAVEAGLTSNAIAVHRGVCANFPSITSFGGVRGTADAHGSGRALDVMVSGDLGWQVARWARANASSLGVTEVIYSQQIWTTQRAGEGWRPMSDRGSATANHYDHVHVTVR